MLPKELITEKENMATKTKFRIVVNECNECDTISFDTYYTIQIQKSFLWFKYWCTLEHTSIDEDNPLKEVTKFKTIEDARECISILKKIKVIPSHNK
jgi:hypothetical protein